MDLTTVISANTLRNTILAALLCGCTLAQATTMYKWVDEEGNTHYDQFPPTDHASEKLDSKSSEIEPSPQPSAQNAELDKPPPTVTEDETEKQKQKNCEVAKKNLEAYVRHKRIQQPDGTVLTLSDEMQQEKIRQAEEDVREYCE